MDEIPFYAPVVGDYYSTLRLHRGGIFHCDDHLGWEVGAMTIGSSTERLSSKGFYFSNACILPLYGFILEQFLY